MHMQSSEQGSPSSVAAGNKYQNHAYLESYMTEPMWRIAQDKTFDWDTKLERAADFMLQIGNPNPNDETVKRIVTINVLCHQATMTPEAAYQHVCLLKITLVNKRQLRPCFQSMRGFPHSPADVMRLHPRVYLDSEPPIASRVDIEAIRQVAWREGMRPHRKVASP